MRAIWRLEANCKMFQSLSIPHEKAGTLNELVSDYLEQKESLRKFYNAFPSLESFKDQLDQKPYQRLDRKKLSGILKAQANKAGNTSAETKENIISLENENTFTITTGHQLCLFTGPLYFIYKIFSVINLCEHLNKELPLHRFVPVYWAASEDHDFEEINHFYAFGKKINWNSTQQGAVGDFSTKELELILPELKQIFGESAHAADLISLFEKSYLQNNSLTEATRYLVNELFGKYGLVMVDGNDVDFKKQFIKEFKSDIFNNTAYKSVSESIEELKALGYNIQVNPREINCFFLDKHKRQRIEKRHDRFVLVNDETVFSTEELNSIIETTPEKISPNVVLRPLYQQTILPNLAYIGGPGELAYWMEYKEMFDESGKFFPMLIMRSSLTIADANTFNKIRKLNLEPTDFFKTEQEITKKYLSEKNQVFETKSEAEKISGIFNELENRLLEIDKTLVATAKAELQKNLNSLQAIEAKANRALKQQSETELKQISSVKEKFYPEGVLQERHDNFSMYYIRFGKTVLEELKDQIHPFDFSHYILYG